MILLQTNTDFFFDTNTFKGIRAVIEIIYLLSAPVVAYLAYRGLEQIKIAKKNSKLNAKREAFRVTAERCADYQNRIIPLQNILFKKEKEKGVKFFKESKVEISEDKITVNFAKDDTDEIGEEILNVINAFEAFSLFFVSGLGDENIAYQSIGMTYIGSIKDYLPFIVLYGDGKRFKNILVLFNVWYERDKKEKLELEKKQLEDKLKTTKSIKLNHLGEE